MSVTRTAVIIQTMMILSRKSKGEILGFYPKAHELFVKSSAKNSVINT